MARTAKAGGEPSRLSLCGRARSDQQGRAYPSIDHIEVDIWPDGHVEGSIERVEPEGRRGAMWGCVGRAVLDTVLLTFWPWGGEGLRSGAGSDLLDHPQDHELEEPWR